MFPQLTLEWMVFGTGEMFEQGENSEYLAAVLAEWDRLDEDDEEEDREDVNGSEAD